MKTRYGTLATLTLAFAASVATFRLAAETYYWIGSSGGDWASGDNWSLSEGGAAANAYPTASDDAVILSDASIAISSGNANVANLTLGGDVTITGSTEISPMTDGSGKTNGLNGNMLVYSSISGAGKTLTLKTAGVRSGANDAAIGCNICVPAGFKSAFYCDSKTILMNGSLSGGGDIIEYQAGNDNGVTYSADCSGFTGTITEKIKSDPQRSHLRLASGTASFRNATFNSVSYEFDKNLQYLIGADNDTYYVGSFNGPLQIWTTKATIYLGGKNESCSIRGTFSRPRKDNSNMWPATIVKEGSARVTSTCEQIGFLELQSGTFEIANTSPMYATQASPWIKFTGGTLVCTPVDGTAFDPSAYIKNSTAAIIFDDEGTSRTWATALEASNVGGLEKKGSGTLTLSAVPLYTGTTTVNEGALVIPGGTTLAKLSVADGATLYVSGTDGQTITITEFADGTTTDNVKAVAGSSLSWNGNTATITRSAATYTWRDATGDHNWATPGNWTIGEDVATVAPLTVDTVEFPAEGAPWDVELSSDITVAAVRFNGNTTLSGAKIISSDITAASTDVTITLGNAAGFQNGDANMALANLSFNVTAASETPAVFYFNKAGNAKSFTLNNTCRFTGSGAVTFGTQFDNSGIEVRADMSDFAGTVNIPKATASAYRSDASINPAASSAKAIWNVDNGSKQSAFFANSGIYYFGSLKGSVSHNYQSVSGSAGYGYLMEIGSLGQDDELGGRYFSANYTSRIKEAQYHAILRKVGNGTLTFTGMEIARFEVNGGVLYCKSDSVFNTYWSTEEKTTTYSETLVDAGNEWHAPITFGGEGGTLKLDEAVTTDLSTNFVGSTKPIAIDDGNTDRTWSGIINSSNTGGLTKKGTGTLTLTAAPAYTGLTTVEAGALVVPQGTELIVNALSVGTLTGATVTQYAYPENTTLVYDGTTRNYASELDLSNVKTVDLSGVTLVNGTTYTIVSATAITGYTKDAIEVVLPEGADETKWVLRRSGNALVLAPKGGFLLVIQ